MVELFFLRIVIDSELDWLWVKKNVLDVMMEVMEIWLVIMLGGKDGDVVRMMRRELKVWLV